MALALPPILCRVTLRNCSSMIKDTFVLDFVNSAEDIRKAFEPYYEETVLEEETANRSSAGRMVPWSLPKSPPDCSLEA